ncbi:beta-1 adrenergic receptor-like [Glandiceps talaboti]
MVNLAVADLLVGVFVMPPNMIDEIVGTWILGDTICRLWIIMDVLSCTASIMNLCMISVDRYYIIAHPFRSAGESSLRRAKIMMLIAWAVSIIVSVLPISIGWAFEIQPMEVMVGKCIFVPNRYYAATASIVAFYIPLFLMIFAYYKVFKIARIQAEKIQEYEVNPVSSSKPCMTGRRKTLAKFTINFKRERRALRTLGIIMGCFLLCWLPFFTTNVINPFINYGVPPIAFVIVTWTGWANSTINPLLYSVLNKEFRRAFRRLLSCVCCSTQSRFKSTFVSLTELHANNTTHGTPSAVTPDKKKEFRFTTSIVENVVTKGGKIDTGYTMITNFGKI